MATNKCAMIRYKALDKCFRNKYKNFYMDDLIDACNEAIYNSTNIDPGIQRRQIYNDIRFMESPEGWSIQLNDDLKDGKKRIYRYLNPSFSIYKRPLDDQEMDMLVQAIGVLNRFKGLPQFEWMESLLTHLEDKFHLKGNDSSVIGFEQNIDYTASSLLTPLFMSIVNKQVIQVNYETFDNKETLWTIHPYYIKQYNNRWFLFGLNSMEKNQISVIPLDRIKAFEADSSQKYIENETIDFDEYFDDVIGVTIPKKSKSCPIVLQFSPNRFPYITTKPLHGSMIIRDKDHCIIELNLIPNKEFESLILSYGSDVKILEPEWLKDKIMSKIEDMMKNYSTCAHRMHT